MKVQIKVSSSSIKEVKEIVEQLIEFEKEHRPHCTLSVEVEIK